MQGMLFVLRAAVSCPVQSIQPKVAGRVVGRVGGSAGRKERVGSRQVKVGRKFRVLPSLPLLFAFFQQKACSKGCVYRELGRLQVRRKGKVEEGREGRWSGTGWQVKERERKGIAFRHG